METIKLLLKKIINLFLFKILIIYLLRNKLISKRFKNLIELNGMHYVYKSKIKVYNDGNDAVTRDLCIFGIPKKEKEIFDKFISEVKNAKSFLDIGAGIGLYTLFTLSRNSHISVLSIEPNPKVFKTLNRNLENFQSGSQIVRTLNKVITSKDKKIEFFIPTGDDFSYGTSNKNLLVEKNISFKSVVLKTTNLSKFKNDEFEVIKIDVEGSELDVLKTISFILKNCRIVFIEIMRENKSEVYDLLKDFNLLPIIESKEDIGNYVFKKTNF